MRAHERFTFPKLIDANEVKKVSIMTRPGDLIAGGISAMGPCPNAQHPPPGIYRDIPGNIPGISLTYL